MFKSKKFDFIKKVKLNCYHFFPYLLYILKTNRCCAPHLMVKILLPCCGKYYPSNMYITYSNSKSHLTTLKCKPSGKLASYVVNDLNLNYIYGTLSIHVYHYFNHNISFTNVKQKQGKSNKQQYFDLPVKCAAPIGWLKYPTLLVFFMQNGTFYILNLLIIGGI